VVQNQRRGGSGPVVVMLIVGGIAGVVVELLQNIALSYALPDVGVTADYVVGVIEGLVTGAVVGGAVLLGRPRNYGIAAAAGVVTYLAGAVGDEASRLVLGVLHDWPISSATFTSYFTHRALAWRAIDLVPVLVAAGLAALGASKNARTPLAPPPGPWGPQAPFGGPPHLGAPYPAPGQAAQGPGMPGGRPPQGAGGPAPQTPGAPSPGAPAPQAPGAPGGQPSQGPGAPGGQAPQGPGGPGQAPWGPGPQQPYPNVPPAQG
jgi:hypothetical protein